MTARPTSRTAQTFFDQGVSAQLDGAQVHECPYVKMQRPFAHHWWTTGWKHATSITPAD